MMISKVLITFGVLIYALLIPYLEINPSHVWNPDWPPHARLHEVWQLTTNIALGALALCVAWLNGQVRLAALINSIVMGSVLFAHLIQDSYGGSLLSGNISKTLLGMELAAFAASLVVVLSLIAAILPVRASRQS